MYDQAASQPASTHAHTQTGWQAGSQEHQEEVANPATHRHKHRGTIRGSQMCKRTLMLSHVDMSTYTLLIGVHAQTFTFVHSKNT